MTPAKRALDVVGAAAGLLVLWPIFLAVAALILVEDGRPVFFRQERIGRGGGPFRIWKFRTMRGEPPLSANQLTVGRDPRITRVGHWLRLFKIDELPQLLNVLKGQMTLVGPRPEVPRYVKRYTAEQRAVLELVPGITDPASSHYRDESDLLAGYEDPERAYVEVIMPDKIRRNLAYAREATVLDDVREIIRTLVLIVRR